MKLIYYIILRITLALTLILTVWAIFFYVTMIDEVNDEVDDALEDYSETIIIRALAGEELPSKTNGSNNQYYMMEVSKEYAESREDIQYKDSMVYIEEKGETEPARILTTIFKDDEGRYHELTVSTPSIEKDDLRDAIQVWIIFLYVALLFCIIIISVWVFYRNMRPLYVLLHWLDGYQTGKRNKLVNVPPLCIVILSQPYSDLSSASASFSEGPFWRMICRLLSSTSKAGWFALDVINTNSFAKEQK